MIEDLHIFPSTYAIKHSRHLTSSAVHHNISLQIILCFPLTYPMNRAALKHTLKIEPNTNNFILKLIISIAHQVHGAKHTQ